MIDNFFMNNLILEIINRLKIVKIGQKDNDFSQYMKWFECLFKSFYFFYIGISKLNLDIFR